MHKSQNIIKTNFLLDFDWLFMFLLTVKFVKQSYLVQIFFFFLKNVLKETLYSSNTSFQTQWKYKKRSSKVRQILGLFLSLSCCNIGSNVGVEGLRVATKTKEKMFEGVWVKLESEESLQRLKLTKHLRLTLVFL